MVTNLVEEHKAAHPLVGRGLDDWYLAINKIYLFQNLERDSASLFMHLVEVCGGLRGYSRLNRNPADHSSAPFVTKALAWWFALCAKVGVRSVEEMVWMKFPGACPYCYLPVHDDDLCVPSQFGPHWEQLDEVATAHADRRPTSLVGYVEMFGAIYQPAETVHHAFARLTEELGELGEAVRMFEVAPRYFLNEAADVFAWLIQCHRLIADFEGIPPERQAAIFEERLAAAYPDRCPDCESPR